MRNFKTYSAIDISSYFIKRGVSPLKLHKLLYYSQLWFFVKNKKSLFVDDISAWIFGPVVYSVWNTFRFIKRTDIIPVNKSSDIDLNDVSAHLDDVWNAYGHLNESQLIELTHEEKPWLSSRKGLLNNQPSGNVVEINSTTTVDFCLNPNKTIPKVAFVDSLGHFSSI